MAADMYLHDEVLYPPPKKKKHTYPSFGMTMTKAIGDLLAWHSSYLK